MPRLTTAVVVAAALWAQQYTSGPQVVTFFSAVDDSDQPYGLYVPRNYDANKKYPLVISLHSEGSNHRLNLRRVFGESNRLGETNSEASRYFPKLKDVEFIVATPLARGTMGYQGVGEKDVYEVLDNVKRRFSIDEDRVYLTGISMGGGGALWFSLTRPDIWAAVAVVAPYPTPGTEELVGNAQHLPVKLFQGEMDPVVKAESTRGWQQRFESVGVRSEYVEYRGIRHNAWDTAYRGASIFEWFAQYKKVTHPDSVRFATRSYEYAGAYWVRFDRLTPGTLATVDARLTAKNTLSISTTNLDAFTLLLKGHPMFSRTAPVLITVDGTKLRSRGRDAISLTHTRNGWRLQMSAPALTQKRPGLEGPIAHALANRHVYVYGTSDSPDPKELEARREAAARDAEWATSRSSLLLTFKVIADTEINGAEATGANLVLFGSKESNAITAKLATKLPVALHPGAADYGLIYVYPLESKYVVIHSGVPWRQRSDQFTRPVMALAPVQLRTMMTLQDLVLFKGGLDNIVAEGRFDQNWRLPAELAAKLRATGAVEVSQ